MDKQSILDLLQQRRFNPDIIPPKEDVILTIGGKTIGTLQNYIVFSGQAKAGKSTFVTATIASGLLPNFIDVFNIKMNLPKDREIIAYWDTESSLYDFYRNMVRIKEFAMYDNFPSRLHAYNTREDQPEIIKKQIITYLQDTPECSVLVVDGFLDLCLNYNDEVETRKLTNWFKFITKKYNILLIGVLHVSKGYGETIGHLGSNTDRWAQSTLLVEKNKETKQFILKSKFLRSSDDFEPVCLMQYEGKFTQIPYIETPAENFKKPKK